MLIIDIDSTTRDDPGCVEYVPFIDADTGCVGYTVTHDDGRVTNIYFNPSTSEHDGDANVFIYLGVNGLPELDLPMCHINIEF